jgi:hypothetical protein
MKLTNIHLEFETDKGTAHSYLEYYDELFSDLRLKHMNVLEIGVLFGGSLKMWSTYFINSKIYGIDNFSQETGEKYYNYKPVCYDDVSNDLKSYGKIKLFNFNCESVDDINNNIDNLKFNIIIDDASHELEQQCKNLINFSKYLTDDGVYICEDIQSNTDAIYLKKLANKLFVNKKSVIKEFNVFNKSDDRLLAIL